MKIFQLLYLSRDSTLAYFVFLPQRKFLDNLSIIVEHGDFAYSCLTRLYSLELKQNATKVTANTSTVKSFLMPQVASRFPLTDLATAKSKLTHRLKMIVFDNVVCRLSEI